MTGPPTVSPPHPGRGTRSPLLRPSAALPASMRETHSGFPVVRRLGAEAPLTHAPIQVAVRVCLAHDTPRTTGKSRNREAIDRASGMPMRHRPPTHLRPRAFPARSHNDRMGEERPAMLRRLFTADEANALIPQLI